MSGTRQLNLVAALGLWASACLAATFYASWQGYGGRRFAVTLCVFALLFAAEILVAARGVQERVSTFFSTRGPRPEERRVGKEGIPRRPTADYLRHAQSPH